MIEVEASSVIRSSREAVWRQLTRVAEWYRWYPGLHGTTASESIIRAGQSWRATGQMGRLLYRGDQQVTAYRMLSCIEIRGSRRPWLGDVLTRFDLVPDGPNCRLLVTITASPGLGPVGRFLLSGLLQRRLQSEADNIVERLASYVDQTMPYH